MLLLPFQPPTKEASINKTSSLFMRSLNFRELITVFFPSFPSYYFNPYNNEEVIPQPPRERKTKSDTWPLYRKIQSSLFRTETSAQLTPLWQPRKWTVPFFVCCVWGKRRQIKPFLKRGCCSGWDTLLLTPTLLTNTATWTEELIQESLGNLTDFLLPLASV